MNTLSNERKRELNQLKKYKLLPEFKEGDKLIEESINYFGKSLYKQLLKEASLIITH